MGGVIEVLPGPAWFGTTAKLGYIVIVRLLETVLGNVFIWAGSPIYGVYDDGSRLYGLSPVRDQALAGTVMMIYGSIVTLGAIAWLFLRWGAESELRQQLVEQGVDPSTAAGPSDTAEERNCSTDAEPGHRKVRSTGIHHLDIVVSSIERSLPFYRELLGPIGWHGHGEVEGERGETIHYLTGPGSSLGLREATTPSDGAYDRYRVGSTTSRSRSAPRRGQRRAEWLRAREVRIESEPAGLLVRAGTTPSSSTTPTG